MCPLLSRMQRMDFSRSLHLKGDSCDAHRLSPGLLAKCPASLLDKAVSCCACAVGEEPKNASRTIFGGTCY